MAGDERAYRLFGEAMRTVNGDGATIRLKTGGVTYYLRTYTDGTFDVLALVDGDLIAVAGVGTDGAIAGANARTTLAGRRDRFEEANRDEIVKDIANEQEGGLQLIGYLFRSTHVRCPSCEAKHNEDEQSTAPLYRVNIGAYRQPCHECHAMLVEPRTEAWPILFERKDCRTCVMMAREQEAEVQRIGEEG